MLNVPTVTIAREELSSAQSSVTLNVDLTNLPFDASLARHLVVVVNARSTRATVNAHVELTLNSDTGNNYNSQNLRGSGSSATAARTSARDYLWRCFIPGASVASDAYGGGEGLLPDALSTRSHKAFIGLAATVEELVELEAARWTNTNAITSVTFTVDSQNIDEGSVFEIAVVDEMYAIPGIETILV